MIPYILRVSILIVAGWLFYKLLLKKLTFYVLNRWILLACLVVAFVLPLLPLPRQWSWEAMFPRTPVSSRVAVVHSRETDMPAVSSAPSRVSDKPPVSAGATAYAPPGKPVDIPPASAAPLTPAPDIKPRVAVGPYLLQGFFYLYLLGVIVLGINMLRQMISLLVQTYRGPVVRDGHYRIIKAAGIHSPCSFGNTIFIHPHRYDEDTYHQILLHEKVHAGGWHTVDILLAELGIVFQWFNPFIWLFRREMENNLEFLTDRNVLQHPGVERSVYQLSLLKVAAPHMPLSITSNYNQSLLKRRIIMMNAQNSARHTAWKYLFLLPLFILLAAILNHPAAVAQSSKEHSSSPPVPPVAVPAPPAPDISGLPAGAPAPAIPAIHATLAPLPGDPLSPTEPLAQMQALPAAPMPSLGSQVPSDTSTPSSRARRMEGSWFITGNKDAKDDKINIELRDQDDDHQWSSSFSVLRSKLSLSGVGKVEFSLTREAGTIHFTGQFDDEQGFGHYKFQPDADYLAHMRQKKIVAGEDELLSFFLIDIKKDYVDMLQTNGFPDVSKGHLISMAALGIDESFIRGVRESGYSDVSENHLITIKALHIDKDFMEDIRKSGYDHLSMEKLITFKSLQIDGAYLRRFPAGTPPQDIITYKSLRIDSDYVASIKREGYPDISSREIVSFRSMKIDAGFIKGFQAIGYKDIPPHKLISLRSLNVTPEYVKSFQDVGYKDISLEDLISMKSMSITPEYVKGFLDLGYKDIAPHHLISLRSMSITPRFIKEFNAIGFKDIPLNQLSSLKAMGVTPAYVSKMKEKGFVSDDLNRYIRLKNAFD